MNAIEYYKYSIAYYSRITNTHVCLPIFTNWLLNRLIKIDPEIKLWNKVITGLIRVIY